MENLAYTIRQLQSGALTRPEFFAELDRVLAAAPESPGRLLEVQSNEHARAPLQGDVYTEVQRRIEHLIASRQRLGIDDTPAGQNRDVHRARCRSRWSWRTKSGISVARRLTSAGDVRGSISGRSGRGKRHVRQRTERIVKQFRLRQRQMSHRIEKCLA